MKILIWLILTVGLYSIPLAQPISLKEREILQLQDQRSLGEGKLVSYLTDKNVRLRYRAAIALANIQDTSTVEALMMSLTDRDKRVRAASAFALGQMGTGHADNALLSAFVNERNTDVSARILEAIGKSGSPRILDSLLNLSALTPMKFPPRNLALCIARFAIRQIKTERSTGKCFELLDYRSSKVRSAALYALWRSAPNEFIDLEISNRKEKFIRLAKSRLFDIRMHLAILLGRSKSNDAREILDALEKSEIKMNNWHVWVQIVRARAVLSKGDEDVVRNYMKYVSMKNDYINISALQAFTTIPSAFIKQSDVADSMRQIIHRLAYDTSGTVEVTRGEALVALGKHFSMELNQFQGWIADTQVSPRLKAKLLEGIAQNSTDRPFKYSS